MSKDGFSVKHLHVGAILLASDQDTLFVEADWTRANRGGIVLVVKGYESVNTSGVVVVAMDGHPSGSGADCGDAIKEAQEKNAAGWSARTDRRRQ